MTLTGQHCLAPDVVRRTRTERLVTFEYVLVHRGTRGQSAVYEMLYDGAGEGGAKFLMGLAMGTTKSVGGEKAERGVPLGPDWVPIGVRLGSANNAETPRPAEEKPHSGQNGVKISHTGLSPQHSRNRTDGNGV